MAIQKVGRVGIWAQDLARMRDFYSRVVGLRIADETNTACGYAWVSEASMPTGIRLESRAIWRTSCIRPRRPRVSSVGRIAALERPDEPRRVRPPSPSLGRRRPRSHVMGQIRIGDQRTFLPTGSGLKNQLPTIASVTCARGRSAARTLVVRTCPAQ
jgi:catechol 2,3-dioxygenase-like lactoylglutathione lyase family enzyme